MAKEQIVSLPEGEIPIGIKLKALRQSLNIPRKELYKKMPEFRPSTFRGVEQGLYGNRILIGRAIELLGFTSIKDLEQAPRMQVEDWVKLAETFSKTSA